MTPCPWCGEPFEPVKRGAHEKRFCRIECKRAFEQAARRYAYRAIATGMLTVEQMRQISGAEVTSVALSPSRATAGGHDSDVEVVG